ncbi:MAG: glycerol kinase GlpK [Pseudomonadales bacterium]|nr:glycerol kinase GlpK [Pseudomonadales bacterium]
MIYLLSIDQGTTSSRAILFTLEGQIHASSQMAFAQHYPHDAWVEHSPQDIWETVISSCRQVLKQSGVAASEVLAMGIANQRETTVVWDRHTGEPVYNAIVWQDRRTAEYCASLVADGAEADIRARTGLLVDPYFSATKLKWILDQIEGAREKAERGELLFGTVDCFLLWKLSGGKSHKTDATNASRTLLFNIHTQEWDQELLKRFNIPASMLPQVMDSAAAFGSVEKTLLGAEIPVLGMAGDQQAALFGQACFARGMSKSTYGTGCFMITNTGNQPLVSGNRLLTTVGYRLKGQVTYALEGSIFMAGATIQWLRDGLKLIANASESEQLAEQTPSEHGVFLVPAFTGMGAPYWDPNARGAILGLTRDTGIREIVTAGLQAVCYQTKDLQKAMEKDGERPTTLRVDGGMVTNDWLMHFLADILGATVDRPKITETTALGVAYLAGLQAGVFSSLEKLSELWKLDTRFTQRIPKEQRDQLYQAWQHAVRRVL